MERILNILFGDNVDVSITSRHEQRQPDQHENIPMDRINPDESYFDLFGDTPASSTPNENSETAKKPKICLNEQFGHVENEGEENGDRHERHDAPILVPTGSNTYNVSGNSTPPHFNRTPGHTYANTTVVKRQAPMCPHTVAHHAHEDTSINLDNPDTNQNGAENISGDT